MKRDLNLDSLKGILILMVVIGHIPFGNFFVEKPGIMIDFIKWFYFFHMSLFFSISVLFIKKDFDWIIKRAAIILTPYLFWFFYGHKLLLFQNPIYFIEKLFIGNWGSLNSIIWFLPALFSLNLIFYIFYKSSNVLQCFIFGISILTFLFAKQIAFFHYYIPFGIDIAFYIFILTFLIQKIYKNQEKYTFIKFHWLLILITLSSCFLFYFEPIKRHTQWLEIIDLAQYSVTETFLGYISFIILNISLFILFLKLKPIKIMILLGRYSFPIFLLHLIVLYKIPTYLNGVIEKSGFTPLIISFLFSIIIPIIASKILMKISVKFKYIGMAE